jgi:hypothetical protein
MNRNWVAASRTWPMLDDQQRGLDAADLLENALGAGLRQQVERRVAHAQPVAARLDLVFRLLARGIEHRTDVVGEVGRRLQQQGRLAYARLAAEQDQGSGDNAAAQHPVELVDAGGDAVSVGSFDLRVLLRPARRHPEGRVAMLGRPRARLGHPLLDKRIERAAVVALALPLRLLRAALLANEYWLDLFHVE